MKTFLSFSRIYMIFAVLFILIAKGIIQSNKDIKIKIIFISLLNFINYLLLLYCANFVSWVVKFNKFHNYPYHYPFCVIVFFCSIMLFIISGIFFIKYQKDTYNVQKAILFLFITHIVSILPFIFLKITSIFIWL